LAAGDGRTEREVAAGDHLRRADEHAVHAHLGRIRSRHGATARCDDGDGVFTIGEQISKRVTAVSIRERGRFAEFASAISVLVEIDEDAGEAGFAGIGDSIGDQVVEHSAVDGSVPRRRAKIQIRDRLPRGHS